MHAIETSVNEGIAGEIRTVKKLASSLFCLAKSVLVTYLERNKVFHLITSDGEPDLKVLEETFRREFRFESNVALDITFQRLDADWGEHIDLDIGSKLNHKDKLKAIVTPCQSQIRMSQIRNERAR